MDTNSILMSIQDKLPKDGMAVINLREKLERMNDAERKNFSDKLLAAKLKNPTTGLILSIMLGGLAVDRFYVGDIGLGILKLILSMIVIGLVWCIIDWFKIPKRIRQDNYNKILMIL